MTLTVEPLTLEKPAEAVGCPRPMGLLAVGTLLLWAQLSLLLVHVSRMWLRPHYHFIALLPVGVWLLAAPGLRRWGCLQPGTTRLSYSLAGGALLLSAVATALWSPLLSVLAAQATLAAAIVGVGGKELWRRLLPGWVLLWLLLPLPFDLDQQLITSLRGVTTRWTGSALDALGVLHLVSGNVVELPERQFFVADACSGIHSLFAALACALFYVLWSRRSVWHALLLLAVTFGWVLVENVARLMGMIGLSKLGMDVTEGWSHEVFGAVLFAATLVLIASADRLILFLLGDGRRRGRRPAPIPAPNDATPRYPPLGDTWLGSPPMIAGAVVLGIVQWWLFWSRPISAEVPEILGGNPFDFATLTAGTMPAQSGQWRRRDFRFERRVRDDPIGEFSQVWHYENGASHAAVSLDYPLTYLHDVASCYRYAGWTVDARNMRAADGADAPRLGPFVEARLRHALRGHGYLLFSLYDTQGRNWVPPEKQESFRGIGAASTWTRIGKRFAGRLHPGGKVDGGKTPPRTPAGPCLQIQVLVESPAPLGPSERRQAQAFFHHLRRLLHAQCFNPPEATR